MIVSVAVAIKQPALLASVALPFLTSPWTSWKLRPLGIAVARALASLGLTVAVFALISVMTGLGFG